MFPPVFYLPEAEGDRLRPEHPDVRNAKDSLKRITRRIFMRDGWEAKHLLPGITGTLPELLAVAE